jgi:hypothetical protein
MEIPTMSQKIKVDNKEYEIDSLSDESKAQLVSIQFVDNELQRLSNKAAALQTARLGYVKALQSSLESADGIEIEVDDLGETLSFD